MPVSARSQCQGREMFQLFLIKPSHYDADGYVIQWAKTDLPSNSLAVLYALASDCRDRAILGDRVDIEITVKDETNCRIDPKKMIRKIRESGGKGLVGLVGVQSNQYPRAMDIARKLRAAGIPVCIGGFHAAGSLAMLPEPPPEVRQAWDLGISIFAGEAEGRFDELLQDAYRGSLKSLYDYRNDLPSLEGAVTPFLSKAVLQRNLNLRAAFDSGRGCPFQCSFCTIINVQGRKSRYRTADDIEKIVRDHYAQGIRKFFITDDNFARNRNWEALFDRLIELRAQGLKVKLIIQVDTLCYRIPNFIRKAGLGGVNRVFIGLENINPDNLIAAKKKQNRITEYRTMLQMWKSIGAMTYCGYIIGFPNDTPERLQRDIEIIKRELPVDLLEFFYLTPLPGSEDHQILHRQGIWMEPDLNKYDTEHVTTAHPLMTAEQWRTAYRQAWKSYYAPKHVMTLMRRALASGMKPRKIAHMALWFYGSIAIENVHPLQAGLFRRKYRADRRPGLPLENPLLFYPRYGWEILSKHARLLGLILQYRYLRWRVESDPKAARYQDLALRPVVEGEAEEELEIFSHTESAVQAVEKARKLKLRPVPA